MVETYDQFFDVSETAIKDKSMLGTHGEELCDNLDVHWMTQTCRDDKNTTSKFVLCTIHGGKRRYRPQTISTTTISATQNAMSAISNVDIGHTSISATPYRPQSVSRLRTLSCVATRKDLVWRMGYQKI